jgi:hypothetical protein
MNRRTNPAPETIANVLRLLPTKWAIGLLIAVIAYVLLQPRINQWFGWHLPSVPAMLGQEEPATASKTSRTRTANVDTAPQTRAEPKKSETPRPPVGKERESSSNSNSNSAPQKETKASLPPSSSKETTANDDLKYRFLEPLGRDRYKSPAGLIYAPGSEEGHRIEHIRRHLEDQPDRPGSHGVFSGDITEFLIAIDDTYKRARGHAKGTKQREEDGATVYEAPFDKPIGFLGGTEGSRRGYPKLKRMRIVVCGQNLITAFPTP